MTRSTRIFALLMLFLAGWTGSLHAQHDLTIYNLDQVPQRLSQNPAFIPEQNFYLGLPVLSGFQTAVIYPFSYNDAFTREADDSLTLEVDQILGELSKNNYVRCYTAVDLLSLGSQIANGKFFLNFSLKERSTQHVVIPEELFYLAWYGNTAPQLFGKSVNLAPSVNTSVYDEWGLTFSGYAMDRRLSYGATVKYLAGRFNVTTETSDFTFYTDSTTYDIYMKSDFEIRTAGVDQFDTYFNRRVPELIFPENYGFGLDLGFAFRISPHFAVNASVLDLGFINWKYNTVTYVSHEPGKEFAFNGLDLHDFAEIFDDLDTFGEKMTDSISNLIEIDTLYDQVYTSWLPARYNIGGSYILNDRHRFNLLLNGISWDHRLYPALAVSWSYNLNKVLGLTASYGVCNDQYWNFGAGVSVSAGPIQVYAVSDNLPALIFYKSTDLYAFQFGLNFVFGKHNPKPEPATTTPPQ